jgi:hypothetical protein
MKSAYMELLLGDLESEKDFSAFESSIDEHFELLDSAKGLIDNLEQITQNAEEKIEEVSTDETEIEFKSVHEIIQMIHNRCVQLNIDAETLKEKIKILRNLDAPFILYIEDLCEQQLVSLNEII